jgi:hypothetical protein
MLVPKSHVSLSASNAAHPMLTSNFLPNVALPILKKNLTLMQSYQR